MSLANCDGCDDEHVRIDVLTPRGKFTRPIEKCVASLVKALNDAGIPTTASCCGHKRGFGSVSVDPRQVKITFGPDGLPDIALLTVDRKKTREEAEKGE